MTLASTSVQLVVGKVDAGVAILLTRDHHVLEFPTLLLPPDIGSGSIIDVQVSRNENAEEQQQTEFENIQDQILSEFGYNEPMPPEVYASNVTSSSCILRWKNGRVGKTEFEGVQIWMNGKVVVEGKDKVLVHESAVDTESASLKKGKDKDSDVVCGAWKFDELDGGKDVEFWVVLRTSGGVVTSDHVVIKLLEKENDKNGEKQSEEGRLDGKAEMFNSAQETQATAEVAVATMTETVPKDESQSNRIETDATGNDGTATTRGTIGHESAMPQPGIAEERPIDETIPATTTDLANEPHEITDIVKDTKSNEDNTTQLAIDGQIGGETKTNIEDKDASSAVGEIYPGEGGTTNGDSEIVGVTSGILAPNKTEEVDFNDSGADMPSEREDPGNLMVEIVAPTANVEEINGDAVTVPSGDATAPLEPINVEDSGKNHVTSADIQQEPLISPLSDESSTIDEYVSAIESSPSSNPSSSATITAAPENISLVPVEEEITDNAFTESSPLDELISSHEDPSHLLIDTSASVSSSSLLSPDVRQDHIRTLTPEALEFDEAEREKEKATEEANGGSAGNWDDVDLAGGAS